jgi:hypothetical protein
LSRTDLDLTIPIDPEAMIRPCGFNPEGIRLSWWACPPVINAALEKKPLQRMASKGDGTWQVTKEANLQ